MLKRGLNVGFSGGEKKRMEILQMAMLEPRLLILDETDSGLDIDALRIVADGVNAMRAPDRSMLVITHYQRLLDYIRPDRVHVLAARAHRGVRRAGAGAPAGARGLRQVSRRRHERRRSAIDGRPATSPSCRSAAARSEAWRMDPRSRASAIRPGDVSVRPRRRRRRGATATCARRYPCCLAVVAQRLHLDGGSIRQPGVGWRDRIL